MRSICRWTQARLPLLAGDDLIGPERRRTERHLTVCADCRRYLASLRDAITALHTAASVEVVPASAPGLWPALARQIRESRRPERIVWPTRAAWPVFALAASFLLILTVALAHRPTPATVAHRQDSTTPPASVPNLDESYPATEDASPSQPPSSSTRRRRPAAGLNVPAPRRPYTHY